VGVVTTSQRACQPTAILLPIDPDITDPLLTPLLFRPDVHFHCDINHDPFKFMEEQKKVYSFTITMYEYEATIPTLWGHVMGKSRLNLDRSRRSDIRFRLRQGTPRVHCKGQLARIHVDKQRRLLQPLPLYVLSAHP
jgi:hypothetical protein